MVEKRYKLSCRPNGNPCYVRDPEAEARGDPQAPLPTIRKELTFGKDGEVVSSRVFADPSRPYLPTR